MRDRDITKEQALRILRQHDLRPTDPTEFLNGRNRAGTPDSTFYAMVGNRKTYSTKSVLEWLGY